MRAHSLLVQSLQTYLDDAQAHRKEIQASIKVLEFLFKFIIRSRVLYMQAEGVDKDEPEFKAQMENLVQVCHRPV